MIDHERHANLPDEIGVFDDVLRIEVQHDVPAERLDPPQHAMEHLQVGRAAKMRDKIEAHATHTGFVERLQVVVRDRRVDDGNAAIAAVAPRDRIEHRSVVGAVAARLHNHPASEAQMVVQRGERFERRIGRRVAAIGGVGKALGGTEHVAVGVARERGERMRRFDRVWIWRKTGFHVLAGRLRNE